MNPLPVELSEAGIYKKMYLTLFNAVTDALNEECKSTADKILIEAQKTTENIFIEQAY